MTEYFNFKKILVTYVKQLLLNIDATNFDRHKEFTNQKLKAIVTIHVQSIKQCPRNDFKIKIYFI